MKVFYGDDVVWEGQVEEIDPAGFAVTYTCLGYGVTLKDQPLGVLFVDRNFDRWKDASEVIKGWGDASLMQFTAPSVQGTDGAVAQALLAAGSQFADGGVYTQNRGGVYVPPFGARIRSFRATMRNHYIDASAYSGTGNATWGWELGVASSDTDNTPTATITNNTTAASWPAATGTQDAAYPMVFVPVSPARFLYYRHKAWFDTTGTPVSDVTVLVDIYHRFYDQVILGELHPDTGAVLTEADMTVDLMIRSILATRIQVPKISTSDEGFAPSRYVVQQATFDEATPETIIQRLCDLIGWEWGVFDGARMYAGPPETVTALGFRESKTYDYPPWYLSLRVEDGHDINVKESNAAVINQVQMKTLGKSTGVRYETVYSNFNDPRCPLNRPGSTPLEIRSRVVDAPEGFGQDDIATYAAALLARYGAPQITGEVTISLPKVQRVDVGTTTPFLIGVSEIGGPDTFGGRPMEFQTTVDAPMIRPGWWCHFPDLDTTLDEPVTNADAGMTRRPTGGLGMVRYVRVEAGDAGAVVTLTLDDGSTRFDTALAQFLEGRV